MRNPIPESKYVRQISVIFRTFLKFGDFYLSLSELKIGTDNVYEKFFFLRYFVIYIVKDRRTKGQTAYRQTGKTRYATHTTAAY